MWTAECEGFDRADFYSCIVDQETLTHTEPDDAIEDFLDQALTMADTEDGKALVSIRERFGETLEVYAFKRRLLDPTDPDPDNLLSDILERLDEEYGGEDATDPTQAMESAAKIFVDVVRAEYEVWQVEGIGSAKVNLEAWVRSEHPEWITSESSEAASGA